MPLTAFRSVRATATSAALVAVAAPLCVTARRAAAQGPAASAVAGGPGRAAHALDAIIDSAAARGFAGVVLVGTLDSAPTPGGATSVVYARAVGTADRDARRPHAVNEVWPWASVTKQVTAALVMGQVAAGRLVLDTAVAQYLPELTGRAAGRATLRDLLRHTAALPNPDATPAGADSVPTFYLRTGEDVGDVAAARGYCAGPTSAGPTSATPDALTPDTTRPPAAARRFAYNNCDYLVLGAVLARVTGRPYAALVRDRVAQPLGLRSLALVADGAPSPVPGYAADGTRVPTVNLATAGAAGALAGTARDLLTFDAALARSQLVPPPATAEMWRGDPALGYVALGAWAFPATLRGCTGPVPLVERRGEFAGVQVRNVIAPTLGRAVVVFTNRADVEFGEIWQGRGLTHALLSAALCPPATR